MRIPWVSKQKGFTIVELLIVIVVIAILVTISVAGFRNIQDRAEDTKTIAAVKAYKKALTMYKLDEGTYPVTGAMCLGDQYGAFTGQTTPASACRYSSSPINATANAAARNLLKPYMGGQLPMPSAKFVNSGATEFVGAHFYGSSYAYTLDGNPVVTIEYYVKGDTCPVGPVYVYGSGGTFTSPSVSRSASLTGGSRCYLLLPDN